MWAKGAKIERIKEALGRNERKGIGAERQKPGEPRGKNWAFRDEFAHLKRQCFMTELVPVSSPLETVVSWNAFWVWQEDVAKKAEP